MIRWKTGLLVLSWFAAAASVTQRHIYNCLWQITGLSHSSFKCILPSYHPSHQPPTIKKFLKTPLPPTPTPKKAKRSKKKRKKDKQKRHCTHKYHLAHYASKMHIAYASAELCKHQSHVHHCQCKTDNTVLTESICSCAMGRADLNHLLLSLHLVLV